jgi:hypothetical protein
MIFKKIFGGDLESMISQLYISKINIKESQIESFEAITYNFRKTAGFSKSASDTVS